MELKDLTDKILRASIGEAIWDHHNGVPQELKEKSYFCGSRVSTKAAKALLQEALGDRADHYMNKMVIKTHQDDRCITMAAIYDGTYGYVFSLAF